MYKRQYQHYERKEEYFSYDLKVEKFQKETASFLHSREDSYERLLEPVSYTHLGGLMGSGGTITIHGGSVTANGGPYAAGIGGGRKGSGGSFATGTDGHGDNVIASFATLLPTVYSAS